MTQMLPHALSAEKVINELNSNAKSGLSSNDAQRFLELFGRNELKQKKKKSIWIKFLEQFKDVMIIILLIAAAISFYMAFQNNDSSEFFEPILILIIIIANAILGVNQESKAEKALDSLAKLSAPQAKVLRDGKEQIINASEVVVGDIILVEAGDFVPADARLVDSESLQSDESALTGESIPVEKDANATLKKETDLADRTNMIYSSCSITHGNAKAIVTSIGMKTQVGKIATLLDNEFSTQTPLQVRLAKLGKILGILAVTICAMIFALGALWNIPLNQIFMTSVSLAVSAIPEGLPAIVTIVLAIGVQRMAKQNAIIRKLPAVETLGSASVICSDKTGTLTQNKMTVVKAYQTQNNKIENINEKTSDFVRELLKCATLCCNGTINEKNGKIIHVGDPTETAIVYASHILGDTKKDLTEKYPRLSSIPFDSERKTMSVLCDVDGKHLMITKGAFDIVVKKCINEDLVQIKKAAENMSQGALRVLAIACKEIDLSQDNITIDDEHNLHLIGLIGLMDPVRPTVKKSIEICTIAGIRPVMITGDHLLTACAIAKELGIMQDTDKAITSEELHKMSDETFKREVQNISVYARATPDDKIRIVKAWQELGQTVAMTGDGVNDAPALKAADIGCAMGITGTDVAKDAADIVLTDDNFSTIVRAVSEGRKIFQNIKRTILFLLGSNIGEVISVFIAMLIWRQTPLLSMHLLWINLVTDGLPAIALGREKLLDNVMAQKPISKNENIINKNFAIKIFANGTMFAILTLLGFWYGYMSGSISKARTMAFLILSLSQIVHSFNLRSSQSLFKTGFFGNKYLNKANLISFGMVAFIALTPKVYQIFALDMLLPLEYLGILIVAAVPILIVEISKCLTKTK